METTAFEIISPGCIVLSGDAEMIVAPGVEGDFGVLPGHAPLISGLRPGVVTIYENDAPSQKIFVGGGVAEAMPEGCTILAEEAMPIEDIDAEAVRQRIAELHNEINQIKSDQSKSDDTQESLEYNNMLAALAVAQAQLAAVDA